MARTTDFLVTIRRIIKLYDNMLKGVCQQYQLSLIEANIISFLYNNPGKDTAREILWNCVCWQRETYPRRWKP